MRHALRFLALLVAIALPLELPAKHFRWASQGDTSTLDPHAQNETFTNGINGLVYEYLVDYDKKLDLTPKLATAWKNTSPTTWVFELRKGVKWQDGSPFTADDVVFSMERAKQSGATFKMYSNQAGIARKLDDYTVEFTTPVPNPILPITLTNLFIMNKAWCEKHRVVRPQDFKNKEETYSSRNAMGTGPYILTGYEPGVKVLLGKNPDWWGIKAGLYEGNVTTIEFRPITNQATRMAALRSGELDFVLDPPVQDVPRMRSDPELRVWEGVEFRFVMIGFDQARDQLLYSDVKGRNPFKDRRVRLALYQAIDIEALKSQVMRGLSQPTAIPLPSPKGAGVPVAMLDKRYPYDPAASRKLLAQAGYPSGFGFTLHCPNDRYVNDEKICIALAAMWAKVGVNVRVETMPKTQYFQKAQNLDVSAFMLGWGGANQDAAITLKAVLHGRDNQGSGDSNYGDYKDPVLDKLIDALDQEMDMAKRQEMINRAVGIVEDNVYVLPLHRQVIPWASRAGVTVIHRANNVLQPYTVQLP
jgi:peptide/nickel transport system substrate-binding protein